MVPSTSSPSIHQRSTEKDDEFCTLKYFEVLRSTVCLWWSTVLVSRWKENFGSIFLVAFDFLKNENETRFQWSKRRHQTCTESVNREQRHHYCMTTPVNIGRCNNWHESYFLCSEVRSKRKTFNFTRLGFQRFNEWDSKVLYKLYLRTWIRIWMAGLVVDLLLVRDFLPVCPHKHTLFLYSSQKSTKNRQWLYLLKLKLWQMMWGW